MNLTRCSKRGIALLLAVLLVGAAGTATAATLTEDNVPSEREVGTQATVTVTVNDLYSDAPSEWTLRAESNLSGTVDWQVSKKKFGNAGVENESDTGSSFVTDVSRNNDVESVTVTVSGTVPTMPNSSYSYDPRQNFSAVTIYRVSDSGERVEVGSAHIEYYTNASRSARQAIDEAQTAINQSGGNSEAESTLESAISSYDNGNFANAQRLANNAQSQAQQAQQSQQTTQMLLYGAVGVVVLLVVVGGVYYWRNQQEDYDKLR